MLICTIACATGPSFLFLTQLFLAELPSSYTLPATCPFLPSLDLLSVFEEGSKQRRGGRGGLWSCLSCGKRFQTENHIDTHIQNFHMQAATEAFVCLADYCDVLDCFHRSVQFDPLTGEVLAAAGDGSGLGGGAGGGALYGNPGGRKKRMEMANQLRDREKNKGSEGVDTNAAASTAVAAAATAAAAALTMSLPSTPHPMSHRCSDQSMALAKLRCESVLLQCFPFHGVDAASTSSVPAGGAAVPAQMSAEEIHGLYERFHSVFCAGLRCTPEGVHVHAEEIVAVRAAATRSRLWFVLVALVVFALATFYCFAFNMAEEFGWKASTRVGGGGASSLLKASSKQRPSSFQSRLAKWLGWQQKRANSKLM